MAEPRLKSIPELLLIALLAFVFGLLGLGSFLIALVYKGPKRVLCPRERPVRPTVLCGTLYGQHEFVRLKTRRMKLHYVVNGPKDKPLMLFLHGFPESWYSWRLQLKEFSTDYRVVAVDMRGYGESDKPTRVSDYHIDTLTSDVAELIAALGHERCILVGHDWGGMVAWFFTHQYPQMVDRLVVCNAPHPAGFEDHMYKSRSQLLKSWYIFFFQVPVLPLLTFLSDDLSRIDAAFRGRQMGAKPGTFTDEDIEVYKYSFAEYGDLIGPINYYRALMRYETPSGLRERKIAPPTLLVWGTKDGALERGTAEQSAKYVDDFSVEWVEGACHWVQHEEPGRVNAAMRKFLAAKART